MSLPTHRTRRVLAVAGVAVGAATCSVLAAPLAALAHPAGTEAPTISVADGTLSSSDASAASLPITFTCEAGTTATILVKLHQPSGDYGFIDGVAREAVACSGERTTVSATVSSLHGDPWQAGRATGEVSIFGQGRATAHQPFAISLAT